MITLLLQRYGLMALGWITTGLTIIGVLLGIRNAGKKAEQVEQMKQALRGVDNANKIRNKVTTDALTGVVDSRVRKFYTSE